MIFIAGLGNPGKSYKETRHNIGFMAVDALAHTFNANTFDKKYESLYGFVHINQKKVLLAKPQTFMNLSVKGIVPFLIFYKIPLENLWVIHDDIDLEFGTIKTKKGGGSAGHNGLKSLDHLVGPEYNRIRVGVGRPLHKSEVSSYVLSPFNDDEEQALEGILKTVVNTVNDEVGR